MGDSVDPTPRVCWLCRGRIRVSADVLALLLPFCLVLDSCFPNLPRCLLWDQGLAPSGGGIDPLPSQALPPRPTSLSSEGSS